MLPERATIFISALEMCFVEKTLYNIRLNFIIIAYS